MAYVGLLVRVPEVFNNAAFIVIFPLTFVANTFVTLENLPGPLETFAQWNPVSTVTQAARNLFGNSPPGTAPTEPWSMANPTLYTLIWVVIFVAVFAPLSIRQYQRTASR